MFFHKPFTDLELSNIQCESRTRISVHTVQLLPDKSFRECENKEVLTLEQEGNAQLVLRVVVCICRAKFQCTQLRLLPHLQSLLYANQFSATRVMPVVIAIILF